MQSKNTDQKTRYVEWVLEDMEIRKKLWDEFPERMLESTKRTAEMMLRRGLVKCKHEQ